MRWTNDSPCYCLENFPCCGMGKLGGWLRLINVAEPCWECSALKRGEPHREFQRSLGIQFRNNHMYTRKVLDIRKEWPDRIRGTHYLQCLQCGLFPLIRLKIPSFIGNSVHRTLFFCRWGMMNVDWVLLQSRSTDHKKARTERIKLFLTT